MTKSTAYTSHTRHRRIGWGAEGALAGAPPVRPSREVTVALAVIRFQVYNTPGGGQGLRRNKPAVKRASPVAPFGFHPTMSSDGPDPSTQALPSGEVNHSLGYSRESQDLTPLEEVRQWDHRDGWVV